MESSKRSSEQFQKVEFHKDDRKMKEIIKDFSEAYNFLLISEKTVLKNIDDRL